jgi:hypothetical protein
MIRAHMTVPTLLPNMTYHEQILGVPYTYVAQGGAGPFFFMPNLWLDDFVPTLGGKLFWGFAKRMAKMVVTADTWAVLALTGDPVMSLDFEPTGEWRPVRGWPSFEPVRRIMSQPLVSAVPVAAGPWFVCSNFDKRWSDAEVRPLSTVVRIDQAFVAGLPCGRFPAEGRTEGIDASPLGSFQVKARWRQSLVYPAGRWGRTGR